jgi:hypothetical protein
MGEYQYDGLGMTDAVPLDDGPMKPFAIATALSGHTILAYISATF